mmetsp:Transcript_14464/g.22602  ORF Transcript_14464/g.22602 Transcript_14464/m.22602 type:complete len:339 (-) Transcript_14464:152-1168(-)
MIRMENVALCIAIMASFNSVRAWVAPVTSTRTLSTPTPTSRIISTSSSSSPSQLNLAFLPDAATSVIAGSIAGAVGVGVAFPLDTLKTKQQVELETCSKIEYAYSPTGEISIVRAPPSTLWSTILDTMHHQGFHGFYGGVQTSMMGQALIKATAFSVNTAALHADYNLATAAATAGFVTAFLAVPVDRIKVLMQSNDKLYESEADCIQSVLKAEGVSGLLTRGLVPTLFREVPAYTLYFYLYGNLMASSTLGTEALGSLAPLVSGALAGAACVVPVHPVDVVKTIVQHSSTDWQDVVSEIYQGRGFEGFWEGLAPRMSRAAVNHSVTFAVYDLLMHSL